MNVEVGVDPWVYLVLVVLLMGSAAFAAGRAVAWTWRPLWQVCWYVLLLTAAARFLLFALFDGHLLSPYGWIGDYGVLVTWGLLGYRIARVRKLTSQYPWIYARRGLLGYQLRSDATHE